MDTQLHTSDRPRRPVSVVPLSRPVLIYVELSAAMAALYGGVGLIAENALGMPDEWLEGTPFDSWVLPGVFLLAIVAVPMILAVAAELAQHKWAYQASTLAGVAEIGWILAQWAVIREFFFLEPVMLVVGVVVIWLAHRAHARGPR